MPIRKQPGAEKPWKLYATLVFFGLSLVITGGYWYVRNRPDAAPSPGGQEAYYSSKTQTYENNVRKAKLLRDHWRKWASNHRELLAQMARAQPDDRAILARVYNELPAHVMGKDAGITHADLHSGGVHFSWNLLGKMKILPVTDPKLKAQLAQSLKWADNRRTEMFTKYRDIEISRSIGPGKSHITLWASGRVTESTYIRQQIPGQPIFIEGKPREIYPAYDFVR